MYEAMNYLFGTPCVVHSQEQYDYANEFSKAQYRLSQVPRLHVQQQTR